LKYKPGSFIYRLDESTSIFAPKYNIDSSVYVNTHSPPSIATVIEIPSYFAPDVHTGAFKDGSISEYTEGMLSTVNNTLSTLSLSLLPYWVVEGANATLFLSSMSKPHHGKL
jgi:hypothetical protein